MKKSTFLILILTLFIVGSGLSCDGNDQPKSPGVVLEGNIPNLRVIGVPREFKFGYTTPNGVKIGSVVEIPADMQPQVFKAIEYGITNQITATKAKYPGWVQKRNLSDYVIGFIEPQATNHNQGGTPALLVYDKYQTAGTVVGVDNDPYPIPMIVLPHQAADDWKYLLYLLHSALNESEHDAEYANDPALAKTLTGADGDNHPHHAMPEGVPMLLIDEPASARGFKPSATTVKCYFPLSK